jgi:hypothetical protein
MLFRLAYYSTNLIRRSIDPQRSELRKLVLTAGVNNRKQGITGGLMFNPDYFGQVLEGDRFAVSALFCPIAQDPRHRSVVIVEASPTDKRIFQHWSMGLAEQTQTAETLNRKFGFAHGFNPTEMNADSFLTYVFEMVKLEDRLISVSVPSPAL